MSHFPLTQPQSDIYYEQMLYPGSAIYNIGGKVEVSGALDFHTFRKAVHKLVAENDCLRSRILYADSVPIMEYCDHAEPSVFFLDFSDHPDPEASANAYARESFIQPFNLESDDLLCSFALLKVGADRCIIFSMFHHIIADGWTISLLFTRLAAAYTKIRLNDDDPEKLVFSYRDFIEDELNYQQSTQYLSDREYWHQKLSGTRISMFLPDQASEYNLSPVSKGLSVVVSRSLYNRIASFAENNGITIFHFLLGVTYIQMKPLCDSDGFIFGLPLLNRSSKKFRNTAGLFMGITPLVMNVDADIDFTELLQLIKTELRENYRHQRFPFSKMNRLSVSGNPEHLQPPYHVFFSYEKHDYSVMVGGYACNVVPFTNHQERAPIAIYVREFDDNKDVTINFEYNPDYFEETVIRNQVMRFVSLLDELSVDSHQRIGSVSLLSAGERDRLLYSFNSPFCELPEVGSLLALFSQE
ncbi:MAG: condensation domain-containing protein, partial [Bacteroidetes bacterium]|nr:condensation domain-containing protein [Bacteroidota bacterium]